MLDFQSHTERLCVISEFTDKNIMSDFRQSPINNYASFSKSHIKRFCAISDFTHKNIMCDFRKSLIK